ncbi:hypothetical protein ACJIZ3_017302 [Penstemon smallii]|uniref:Shugoshin C-terminal domain-containing protein n=1 Tax=Penstemon smallii TaxID=265156 RepID=A0ABD3SV48_9LAMI
MMERDKMAKRSSFGGILRRKLADITNSMPQNKSPVVLENLPQDTVSAKEYIDHLVKEKAALVKHIQDKNKIIELTGIEIQNMRACLQKMQMQNWSLAKSNSLMLAELNSGKEMLKKLQHEVSCKEALLKTKNLDLKGQEKVNIEKNELKGPAVVATEPQCEEESKPCNVKRRGRPSRSQSLGNSMASQQHTEKEAVGSNRRCVRRRSTNSRIEDEEPTVIIEDEEPTKESAVVAYEPECEEESKPCNAMRRGRPSRSQSLGSSMVSQPHTENEPAVSKRRCVRRRSTSSRIEDEEEPTENLFEIDEAKFPIHEDGLSNLLPLSNKKLLTDGNSGSKYGFEESRRMSTGRPLRKAAEKIQSYKEKPVNVKMRRPE